MTHPTLKTNKLAGEKSPYLLQHQHNPVDWLPWGEIAFERARTEDKPIFLSIGYSTCHWCHVMERECFENDTVAAVMNENFINIKVDREERPDIDRVYMTFVQATTGSGGWPMSVFLTPDLVPFYGGTYFPPGDGWGRPGFGSLLAQIARAWREDRPRVLESGDKVMNALREYSSNTAPAGAIDWNAICGNCCQQLVGGYDTQYGGFGAAPKFPRPVTHDFLHRYYATTGDAVALHASAHTLRAMSMGGIHDHLAGGFHRYSVDEFWVVSHFEKMLYDQAQLVVAYLEAHQLTGDAGFAATARATLDYVLHDMTHELGGFFAAEDADSFRTQGDAHKEEGAFYVWTGVEIETLLGAEDAALFNAYYSVLPDGNAPPSGDPHGEFKGSNILFRSAGLDSIVTETGKSVEEIEASLARCAKTLLAARVLRPRPHRDDKVIVAWNGLMISAFARAAMVLGDDTYLAAAKRAAGFIRSELYDNQTTTLRRHWTNGAADIGGFADDYAFMVRGLLDLFEATGEPQWLQWGQDLNETLERLFWDAKSGGYYNSAPDPSVLLRLKEDYDGAEPAASSIAALNNLRLAMLLDDERYRQRALAALQAFSGRVSLIPQSMPELLCAALDSQAPPLHVVIVGPTGREDTRALLREVHAHFIVNKFVLGFDGNDEELTQRLPFIAGMKAIDGRATAYVCRDFACREPITEVAALRTLLLGENSS